MRVLFTTWAWPSHYFPMVPLAWALRAAGHEVRMASQPELAPTMQASGLPSVIVGRDYDVAELHRRAAVHIKAGAAGARPAKPEGDGTPRDLSMFGDMAAAVQQSRQGPERRDLSLFGSVAEAMVDDLVEFTRAWRPDLIVFDPLTYAAPVAAEAAGVPAVRHLFGPDVTYFTESLEAFLLQPILERFGLEHVNLQGILTVDPCPPSLQFSDAVTPVARRRMRYVPYNGLSEIPPWVWHDAAKPRICLTWGTSTARLVGDNAFVPPPLIEGCARLAAERDAELVLAITKAQRALLPDLPDGVRVAESVPLQALLPTCSVLVHQGGAGTTLTGLLSGLPQVVVTQLPDQAVNARNLVAAGAARTMAFDEIDASTVYEAVRAVKTEPRYRAAAAGLRDEIRELPPPADLVDDLLALVGGARPAPVPPAPAWTGEMFKMPFDEYLKLLETQATAR
jgi:UDP:flavonoid glycosyltransferase YjiC (YdhE family)